TRSGIMLRSIKQSLSSTLAIARKQARSIFTRTEAGHSSKPPRIRPRLEILEDRVVPATYLDYWYGTTSSDWSTASNWTTDGGQHVVPDKNAIVVFGAFGITPKDCTMNVTGGTTIDALTIGSLYTKTLTLNTSLTIKPIFRTLTSIMFPHFASPGS